MAPKLGLDLKTAKLNLRVSRTAVSKATKELEKSGAELDKYQPSGAGGTPSPPATPAKSKMAARGPQNGRRGLERCPTPGYWPF